MRRLAWSGRVMGGVILGAGVTGGVVMAQHVKKFSPGKDKYMVTRKVSIKEVKWFDGGTGKPSKVGGTIHIFNNPQVFQTLGYSEAIVGQTTYDLQTNASSFDRVWGDLSTNKWSCVWTFSLNTAGGWPDRGTGYNYFDGTAWGPQPTARLENVRTGWPNLVWTANGFEISIAHDPANNKLIMMKRQIGTGSWTQIDLDTVTQIALWPRLGAGGPDGNTLHLIGLTVPSAFGGTPYQGMDGALLYCRSLDGGNTWDIVDALLPEIDSLHYPDGISGDAYAIDVRGNVVAIALNSLLNGIQVWKSVDNGTTWIKYEVLENYLAKYGYPDPIDTIYTGDESIEVLIDTNNKVHAFWGAMEITNYDTAQGTLSYFPLIDEIDYWNEDMGHNNFVTGIGYSMTYYLIATNQLTLIDQVGQYRLSGTSTHPTAVLNESNGCIYLLYDGISEQFSGSQFFKHIYAVRSCDGGCTWTTPLDVTNLSGDITSENVFPSAFHRADTAIRCLFQRDYEPGMAVDGDQDPIGQNAMIFATLATNAFDTIATCNSAPYVIAPSSICVGQTDTIWAFCGTEFSWSSGATTSYLPISAPDTYYVTIINSVCGDTHALMIDVDTTIAPPSPVIIGPSVMCSSGDTVTLHVAFPDPNTSYVWSTGTGGPYATVTAPGTYWVTATNCVGTGVDSFTVSPPAPLAVTITATQTTICEGTGTISINASVQGGVSPYIYMWSNGAATSQISLSTPAQSGAYSVTVTDKCGTTVSSNQVTVDIYPSPPVPTIDTFKGPNPGECSFVASQDPSYVSYTWYINGVPSGNNDTLVTDCSQIANKTIWVEVSNSYGCTSSSSQVTGVEDNLTKALPLVLYDRDYLLINAGYKLHRVIIEDMTGRTLIEEEPEGTFARVSIKALTGGLYIVKVVKEGTTSPIVFKFVKY